MYTFHSQDIQRKINIKTDISYNDVHTLKMYADARYYARRGKRFDNFNLNIVFI